MPQSLTALVDERRPWALARSTKGTSGETSCAVRRTFPVFIRYYEIPPVKKFQFYTERSVFPFHFEIYL